MAPIVGRNPCTAHEAVARMLTFAGVEMPYELGSGDYHPRQEHGGIVDVPWTPGPSGVIGSDCAGAAICFAYKLARHRPGFASGRAPKLYWDQSDVDDDINCNSAIEDALTVRELFTIVPRGEVILPGDLLTYPTLTIHAADGELHRFIGHVQMAIINPLAVKSGGPYSSIVVAQCFGGNGRKPAIMVTDAHAMDRHDQQWPREQHRAQVLRVRADIAIV